MGTPPIINWFYNAISVALVIMGLDRCLGSLLESSQQVASKEMVRSTGPKKSGSMVNPMDELGEVTCGY